MSGLNIAYEYEGRMTNWTMNPKHTKVDLDYILKKEGYSVIAIVPIVLFNKL